VVIKKLTGGIERPMIITCNNVTKLPYLEKMRIVAGRGGLNKVIKWVHVMENPKYTEWLKGGELLLTTGVAIGEDISDLLKFIEDINSRNLSGLVINVGPYIKEIPEEVIKLGDSLDFPIFELPFEVGFIDISQSICRSIFTNKIEQESMDNFMKDIIFNDLPVTDEFLNRAISYGYNPQMPYCAFIVKIDNFRDFIKNNKITDEREALEIKQHVGQVVTDTMNKWNRKVLHTIQNNSIELMLPIEKRDKENDKINNIAKDVIKEVKAKINDLNVNIGIGDYFVDLKNFRKSIVEAEKVLKILPITKEENIGRYKDMGIYRVFFELDKYEEIKSIYEQTLGSIIAYDHELLDTLEVFIEDGCNLSKTSERLFVHRNTLRYRINKIEEISGKNLRNIDDIFSFSMALKIGKFLKCI
jgi:DNA-binding PucR family transcriptional regulator